jgi:hypothetical protein
MDVTTAGLNEDTVKISDTGTDTFFALGLRYPLSERIGINLEAKRFMDVGGDEIGSTDISLFSAGLLVRF